MLLGERWEGKSIRSQSFAREVLYAGSGEGFCQPAIIGAGFECPDEKERINARIEPNAVNCLLEVNAPHSFIQTAARPGSRPSQISTSPWRNSNSASSESSKGISNTSDKS